MFSVLFCIQVYFFKYNIWLDLQILLIHKNSLELIIIMIDDSILSLTDILVFYSAV